MTHATPPVPVLKTLEPVVALLAAGRRPVRLVALGSSNTQRGLAIGNVQNWVDWVDTLLGRFFGRLHITINAGISGQTAKECLDRFAGDVALFEPHVLFVTVGGNDAYPERNVGIEAFGQTLREIVVRARQGGAAVVLQTYYAFDIDALARPDRVEYGRRFHAFMQAVRDAADQTGAGLLDPLRRWERLRAADVGAFRALLHDPQHLNALGNLVFALDVARAFGVGPVQDLEALCATGLAVQRRLDELAAAGEARGGA